MANTEIRIKLAETGVKQYAVADNLGIADTSFSRKLRYELPEDEKNKILSIIDGISKKQSKNT